MLHWAVSILATHLNSLLENHREKASQKNHSIFFHRDSAATNKVTASPFQGVVTGQKAKTKIHSHSHSHTTTAQTLLGTPGDVQPDSY